MSEYLSPAAWTSKARDELAAAELLAAGGLWSQSFHHAGMAVEFALKARIMRRSGMNRWPERPERRDLHSHDFAKLAELAGVIAELIASLAIGGQLGLNWLVAKDWDINVRYDPMEFPVARRHAQASQECGPTNARF